MMRLVTKNTVGKIICSTTATPFVADTSPFSISASTRPAVLYFRAKALFDCATNTDPNRC